MVSKLYMSNRQNGTDLTMGFTRHLLDYLNTKMETSPVLSLFGTGKETPKASSRKEYCLSPFNPL